MVQRGNPLAWASLGAGAIISCLVAGFEAAAWAHTDKTEKIVGFFALAVCVLGIDSLMKARSGMQIVTAGPVKLRLLAAGLLTALALVLLGVQISATGFAFNVRLMFDAVFFSIGLVMLGQALFSAATR